MCLSVCVCLSVSVRLCFFVSSCLSLSLSLYVSLCVSLCPLVSVSNCLCFSLYICLSLSLSLSLSVSLFQCPVCSSLWHVSHDSGIFIILGSSHKGLSGPHAGAPNHTHCWPQSVLFNKLPWRRSLSLEPERCRLHQSPDKLGRAGPTQPRESRPETSLESLKQP